MKIRNLTAFTTDDNHVIEITIRDKNQKLHRVCIQLPIDVDDLAHKLSMAGFQLSNSLKRDSK